MYCNMFHYRDRSPEDLRHKVSRQHDTGRSDDSADDSDSDSDRVICSNFPLGEEIFPFNFAEIYPYSSIWSHYKLLYLYRGDSWKGQEVTVSYLWHNTQKCIPPPPKKNIFWYLPAVYVHQSVLGLYLHRGNPVGQFLAVTRKARSSLQLSSAQRTCPRSLTVTPIPGKIQVCLKLTFHA